MQFSSGLTLGRLNLMRQVGSIREGKEDMDEQSDRPSFEADPAGLCAGTSICWEANL